mmetsp:Transcript_19705/g.43060  ORF Transcript_19705/g.43060 Transcript_19705/m.43060 type:complete len:271 (+) Transcript_19705:309-1121(+)|eukprot:CAMPEP_0118921444 /NCGR_PEP_ID=MMETSP1169-20130426/723_1 /TAXON_ID=36882 /ORGANISM="Pyramimonas obovata, Strain CCMP722" /LENGTH=270 /DNA_ID=CAMNT_0006862163 /DNA_START=280 /DNA_END=1092 /DNA_ORIENTATION=-
MLRKNNKHSPTKAVELCDDGRVLKAVENIILAPLTKSIGTLGRRSSKDPPGGVLSVEESVSGVGVKGAECPNRTCEGTSTSGQHASELTQRCESEHFVTPERPMRKSLLPSMPSLFEDEELFVCEEMEVRKTPRLARCCRKWQRDIVQKSLLKCRKNAQREFLDCLRTSYGKVSTVALQQAVNSWHARKAARLMEVHAGKPTVLRAQSRQPAVTTSCSRETTTMERLLGSRLCAVRGITLDHTPVDHHPSLVPLYADTKETVNMLISGWP